MRTQATEDDLRNGSLVACVCTVRGVRVVYNQLRIGQGCVVSARPVDLGRNLGASFGEFERGGGKSDAPIQAPAMLQVQSSGASACA